MVLIKKYIQKKELKKQEFNKSILEIIWKILNDEEFLELKKHRHHLFFNRYEHLINAARIAFKLARLFRADIQSCTLAWILHDFHFTRVKSYLHWVMAAENAKKFDINEKVQSLIKSHMYPFGMSKVNRIKWVDFWIVKFADFWSMCYEITYSILFLSFKWKNKIKLKNNRLLIECLPKDNNVLLSKQA